ncbi:hypothetical protein BDY17DRAFT_256957 [Neohortaea acidophila]|uniref:Secreted protein n=1 Tax=Neohortaea acidophila TaxID=245834 RepID=A0A6A6PIH2_9PEZI|nr:uncharacterized protein BDY17DRAFT_256957 [Neohortaea acidophila]KAF2479514.1 hypothetical protein BDY17DRAFT_256957 [Neohortaea acidophila]
MPVTSGDNALPPTPQQHVQPPPYNPQDYANQPKTDQTLLPPPPKRNVNRYSGEQDVQSPVHYTRDPKKLVAYLVPFPKPRLPNIPPEDIPTRFLIYTPPPPPFVDKPAEGEKEGKVHKVQRKWQEEIREAKTSKAETMSWKEMLLIYPSSMTSTAEQMREEFINTMMRSKTKAQRDAVIATGLLPVSAAIDILLTVVWPFGGLLEIDSVWAYASIRGAKTSRSITKRLTSTSTSGRHDEDTLHLDFTPSPRLAVLEQYLAARCHSRSSDMFPSTALSPGEGEVLESIGWFPSNKGGVERNWEDEQWEISEVKDDLRNVMGKGSKEWVKWCELYAKKPEKALKK